MTRTRTLIWTLMLSTTLTSPSYAFFKLGNNAEDLPGTISKTLGLTGNSSTLVSQIAEQFPISGQQATGGVGSMLSYAKQALPAAQSTELTSLLPGIDSLTNAMPQLKNSSLTSMDEVNSVFRQLGMESSMVTQFAPVILKYLTSQGASTGLISSLTSLWQ
ncbi:DUF2780 domain-containing protein [Vibrio rhizosphaerae]|uniref:DUF2780 domain-containing protein n=1 Tax=Vibrio rhizosphaerae TaxID=398736 RepID=UPI000570364E|nr:DUF2780 domain-containing protein [Vibrio rhizosphaerae]